MAFHQSCKCLLAGNTKPTFQHRKINQCVFLLNRKKFDWIWRVRLGHGKYSGLCALNGDLPSAAGHCDELRVSSSVKQLKLPVLPKKCQLFLWGSWSQMFRAISVIILITVWARLLSLMSGHMGTPDFCRHELKHYSWLSSCHCAGSLHCSLLYLYLHKALARCLAPCRQTGSISVCW